MSWAAFLLSLFLVIGVFLYPLKTSENLWFTVIFRGTEKDQWQEMGCFLKMLHKESTASELRRKYNNGHLYRKLDNWRLIRLYVFWKVKWQFLRITLFVITDKNDSFSAKLESFHFFRFPIFLGPVSESRDRYIQLFWKWITKWV